MATKRRKPGARRIGVMTDAQRFHLICGRYFFDYAGEADHFRDDAHRRATWAAHREQILAEWDHPGERPIALWAYDLGLKPAPYPKLWSWPRPIRTEAEAVYRLIERGELAPCRFNGTVPIASEMQEITMHGMHGAHEGRSRRSTWIRGGGGAGQLPCRRRRLHLSQPALTRRLQKLEAALGVQLIDRDSRQLRLSSVGRDFFFKAKRLLDELDAAVLGIRELADQASGEVTIGAVPTATYYFLPRVIEDFNAQYPRIRIRILDLSANDVLEAVKRGQAEFGINLLGAQEPDIDFEPLLRDPFLFICRHDHALAGSSRSAGRTSHPTASSRSAGSAATGSSSTRHWRAYRSGRAGSTRCSI